jgi:predicted acyltransferase
MTAAARYQSLDVLRGLTVALMIIVNTPGDWSHVYSPLLHAPWHGFTLTDWVFPSFLFVVGNALAFTLPRYEGMGDAAVLARIAKRSVTIVALGLLLCLLPKLGGPLSEVRLPGVLQRIGIISASVVQWCSVSSLCSAIGWSWRCLVTIASKAMQAGLSTFGCLAQATCTKGRAFPSIRKACSELCPPR